MGASVIPHDITMSVLKAVASAFHLPITTLRSRSRQPYVVHARQAVMYLLRLHWPELASFPEIGRVLERDHTTVMHAVEAVKQRLQANSTYAHQVFTAQEQLLQDGCVLVARKQGDVHQQYGRRSPSQSRAL